MVTKKFQHYSEPKKEKKKKDGKNLVKKLFPHLCQSVSQQFHPVLLGALINTTLIMEMFKLNVLHL